ncbi:hypothetical protein vseg_006226 [Gypsophila vaccaria]
MEEVRKWSVTYTKHVKQKRKVYQEGFLHLHSNNKKQVMLYDDCHNLLDSYLLKKSDAVQPGVSLTFPSFLVDISDPYTTSPSILLPNPTFQSHTINTNPTPSITRTSANSFSPSHHIIKEFKKNEVIKYTTHHTPSTVTTSPLQEWEALYTTQVTQKAKKYHDGFIHLIICGSQSRQVALYDSSKTQIDKRFLKKDEVICSGASLKFDGHLVDIGDVLGNTSNDTDVKNEASNSSSDQVTSGRKWHKLSNENLAFNPQRCKEPARRNHLSASDAVEIDVSRNCADSSIFHNSTLGGLRIDKMNPTKIPCSSMPPRDVHHILSILKKPAAQDNVPILEKATVKQCLSQSSVVDQVVIEGKPSEGVAQSDRHQTTKVTNEYDCDEAGNRGSTQTWSTGNPLPETCDNTATAQRITDCSSNEIERPVFTQGSTSEFSNKSEPSVGTAPTNRLQASVNRRQSITCQAVHCFEGSVSPGSQETRSTHPQPCAKLPETNASSVERTFSTPNKSKKRRLFRELNGMKIMRNNMNAEILSGALDCPSFDLGI